MKEQRAIRGNPEFLQEQDCQIVAACDIDKGNLEKALKTINGHYNEDLHLFSIFIETLSPYGTMYSDSTAF